MWLWWRKVQCCKEQCCIGSWNMLGPWIKANWKWSNKRYLFFLVKIWCYGGLKYPATYQLSVHLFSIINSGNDKKQREIIWYWNHLPQIGTWTHVLGLEPGQKPAWGLNPPGWDSNPAKTLDIWFQDLMSSGSWCLIITERVQWETKW